MIYFPPNNLTDTLVMLFIARDRNHIAMWQVFKWQDLVQIFLAALQQGQPYNLEYYWPPGSNIAVIKSEFGKRWSRLAFNPVYTAKLHLIHM